MCVPKRAVPHGDEHSRVRGSVTEAIGYFRHPCCHTRQSVRRTDQTTVVSCWPGRIWESSFAFWPSGVNNSQTCVSHARRFPTWKMLLTAAWIKVQQDLGPVRTNGNEDAIQDIKMRLDRGRGCSSNHTVKQAPVESCRQVDLAPIYS